MIEVKNVTKSFDDRTVLHNVSAEFFPGKTNWIFDAATDQVILILPEVYFRNCAILALVILFVLVAVCLVLGRKKRTENVRETAKTAP